MKDRLIEDKAQTANELNNFFINSLIAINSNISNFDLNTNTNEQTKSSKFSKLSADDIVQIMRLFKNKIGGV